MLKCSHENLQDAHVMLQVSYEFVVASVKYFQPPTQKCTYSLNSVNFICANVCCSQSQQSSVEQIHVESCDDFLAQEIVKLEGKTLVQPTQDCCDHMVNKLELGTTVNRHLSQQKYKSSYDKRQEKAKKDLKHIQCFNCYEMDHCIFMCSTQVENKTRLSRRQRKLMNIIVCFGRKKECRKILIVQNFKLNPFPQAQPVRPVWKIGQTGPSLI
jgi:hypothetical protein